MRPKRNGNKNRNQGEAGLKRGSVPVEAKAAELTFWLKIDDGETPEDEWLGELRAPKSQPLPTRRKK
jgi:hypothetical protein